MEEAGIVRPTQSEEHTNESNWKDNRVEAIIEQAQRKTTKKMGREAQEDVKRLVILNWRDKVCVKKEWGIVG